MTQWIDETLHSDFRFSLKAEKVLLDTRTPYQHLVIFENGEFGRVMMLDGTVQLTTRDEFIYHEMLTHVPLFAHGGAARVLIVGGGDGGILREVLRHETVEKATLCELDAQVIEAAKAHLPEVSAGAFEDARTDLVIADAAELVAETDQRFDAILVDSPDPVGPAEVLFGEKFYSNCKRALAEGGVLATQNGLPFVQAQELRQSMARLRSLFVDVSAYMATIPSYVGGEMAFGWASDNPELRGVPLGLLESRLKSAKMQLRYYTPELHQAAFALPKYVGEIAKPTD